MLPSLDMLGTAAEASQVGAKAKNLGIARSLGLSVPDGFVVPAGIGSEEAQLGPAIARLEAVLGLGLGDPLRPLVLAVRASSPVSMPGQLDTILCFGATLEALPALTERLGTRQAALAAVHQVRRDAGTARGEPQPRALPSTEPQIEAAIASLPEVPATFASLSACIEAIRARAKKKGVDRAPVIVQAMVFGTAEGTSGAMVAHSRHPVTGERGPRGEWVAGQLGDQLTGGRVTPSPLSTNERTRGKEGALEVRAPAVFVALGAVLEALERAWAQPVEVELAVEKGALSLLQVRPATLGPVALVTATVALVEAGVIDRRTAFVRIDAETLRRAGKTELPDQETLAALGVVELGRGLVASPGVATGRLYIRPEDILEHAPEGPVVLVRSDANPEDAPAVRAATAVATASGGLTSHAAVMSRALGRPCAVSIASLRIDERSGVVSAHVPGSAPRSVHVGEWVTVDGSEGRLFVGQVAGRWTTRSPAAQALIDWANAELGSAETEPGVWYEQLRAGGIP